MNLKKIMKQQKTKREVLANQLQIPKATLDNYIAERRQPDINTLIKLADFYNTSIDYIVGRETRLINLDALEPEISAVIEKIINMDTVQKAQTLNFVNAITMFNS